MLSNQALTTLESAKAFLGIDSSVTKDDANITLYINSASALINKYCNRQFGLTQYDELINGSGTKKLILDNYPVMSIDTLLVDENNVDVSQLIVTKQNGIVFWPNGFFTRRLDQGRFMHPAPDVVHPNIYVSYQSGYVLPKDHTDENPRTLPHDIELACLKLIRIINKSNEVSQGKNVILKREQLGDWMVEYEPEVKSDNRYLNFMDADALAILDMYKKDDLPV